MAVLPEAFMEMALGLPNVLFVAFFTFNKVNNVFGFIRGHYVFFFIGGGEVVVGLALLLKWTRKAAGVKLHFETPGDGFSCCMRVPVQHFTSPSWSIHFGDVSETNSWETPKEKQNAHVWVAF